MGDVKLPEGQHWYTMEDVAKHDKETDCWIVVQGNVINVTHFLNIHPGGKDILLEVAGTDPTLVWETIHAPGTIEKVASQFIVGKIKGWTPPEAVEEESVAIWVRNDVGGGPFWALAQVVRWLCNTEKHEKEYARKLKATYGPREQRITAPDNINKEKVNERAMQASMALRQARK